MTPWKESYVTDKETKSSRRENEITNRKKQQSDREKEIEIEEGKRMNTRAQSVYLKIYYYNESDFSKLNTLIKID